MAGLLSSFVPFVSSLPRGDLRQPGRAAPSPDSRVALVASEEPRLPLVGHDVEQRGCARRVLYCLVQILGRAGFLASTRHSRRTPGSYFLVALFALASGFSAFAAG